MVFENAYMKQIEKKRIGIKKSMDQITNQIKSLKEERERLFMEWHSLRNMYDTERETGYPHGKK